MDGVETEYRAYFRGTGIDGAICRTVATTGHLRQPGDSYGYGSSLIVRTKSWAAGHGGTSRVPKQMAASGAIGIPVKALRLMIPQAFLLRACEVIE